MKVFEVCLTNYCNFKCTYCISDPSRGLDKFSEPLKLDENGNLLLHDKELSQEEVAKREKILIEEGQIALDAYVDKEHSAWVARKHLKHDYTDWLNFDKLIEFVRSNLNSDWIITLTGGEPLYYPKIEYLIKELTITNKVVITTNASMVRSKTDLLNIDREKILFRVGFHPEFRNLETFAECMRFIIENKFKYVINYVAHPSYYENGCTLSDQHIHFLLENGYFFEVTAFEGIYKNKNYPTPPPIRSSKEVELFNQYNKYGIPNSAMGTSFIMCEPDGGIYECHGKHKKLGDVYRNELELSLVHHKECFSFVGCNASKSANTYLNLLLNADLA